MPHAPCPFTRELTRITCVNTWLRLTAVAIDFACPRLERVARETWASVARRVVAIFGNYDRAAFLSPAAFYHEGRLYYPFDPRSHECARTKPKPCGSAGPRRRRNRAALSQDRGGALFHPRRRGPDRAGRRTS